MNNIYTKVLVFIGLLILSFSRYILFPDPIEGLGELKAAFLHTALIGGQFIAVFATFVILSGKFKSSHFYLSIVLAFVLYQINFLSALVFVYIYVFQGEIGLPHEPFPVTKHNMYMTYFFALAATGLFCLSKERNIFRTLVVFPVLILGIGMAYYHTYQFFLYSQSALDSMRTESAEYFKKKIVQDDFLQSCEGIKNLQCAEFADGEPFPDHLIIESSPVLFELKNDYEKHGYETIRGFNPPAGFHNAWENGQIDDTQSPSFWATITFYRLNGVNRLAVHDFISEVHKSSFSAAIAFLAIISAWSIMMLLLLEKHKKFRHLVSDKPRAPWYAFLMLPLIFFVSNLEALQDRFHWYALFLIVFCGGWRFFARKNFYMIGIPTVLLVAVMSVGTFKADWLPLFGASLSALMISFLTFSCLIRNEIGDNDSYFAIKMISLLVIGAGLYFIFDGTNYAILIPGMTLLVASIGIYRHTSKVKRYRVNTLFIYMALFVLSFMSLVFMLGINPYNLHILETMWDQVFVTSPKAANNYEEKVYAFYVFTFASLMMFINLIFIRILSVHKNIRFK